MCNCPIIPSITWFSRASWSISSCIWKCSTPDRRGHDSNKPMRKQLSVQSQPQTVKPLTHHPNVNYMGQMALQVLHCLCQLGGVCIGQGECRLEGERDDVRQNEELNNASQLPLYCSLPIAKTMLWKRILLACWEIKLSTLTKNFFQLLTQGLTWECIQKTFPTPLGNHKDP